MMSTQALESRARTLLPQLLRERVFRRFWLAETISLLGDQISMLALPLVAAIELDAGPAQMGYLTAAALVPHLLVSLHAGAWVDRRGRRRQVMIAADVGRFALLVSIPAAFALDALTIEQLYVVAILSGTLTVFFNVSYTALFVSIVPRERYVEGNSLVNGSRAFSYVAGPSIGGVLVQVFTAPLALLADAVSFLGSAFLLRRISPVEPPAEEHDGSVLTGLRWIRHSPVVRSELAATTTINFFNFAFFALFVLYATRSLGVAPATLGLVLGAGAFGGLIGAFVTGRVADRLGIGPAFVLGCVAFPAPLLLVPLADGPHALVLAMLFLAEFASGLGVMILDISAGTINAALIPHRLRARVSGAFGFVNYGVRPLGALAGGWLGATIGLRPTLWIATVGAIAGVLWLLASPLPRLRELPDAEPLSADPR
jgi:MFS family permease